MGLNTCCPRTWSVCAVVRFPPSVPWHSVNSRLASKHWSDSSGRNRYVAYMNASSVFSRLKASRSILACSHLIFWLMRRLGFWRVYLACTSVGRFRCFWRFSRLIESVTYASSTPLLVRSPPPLPSIFLIDGHLTKTRGGKKGQISPMVRFRFSFQR